MATEALRDTRVTLEQWRALLAVVDAGGYAQAAEALGKSQAAVSYSVRRLEDALGLKAFTLEGRKAALTDEGQLLYRRARYLLEEAGALEAAARSLAAGVEAEIRLAVDQIYPLPRILCALEAFARQFPDTRVELIESVLSGTEDALIRGEVDLAVISRVPPGFLGRRLWDAHFVAVTSPGHPLQQLGRPATAADLRQHRHLVIRDSGAYRRRSEGWLGSEQRWTVSHISTSIRAAVSGLGFAWYPRALIEAELADGRLQPLELEEGAERQVTVSVVLGGPERSGPAARQLAELLLAREADARADSASARA